MAGKITALKPQKRFKNRLNVYLDNEFSFGLAAINAAELQVGMWLSDEEIKTLRAADEVERAHEKALDYLSYRPRSEFELERYLTDRDFAAETVTEVIRRLSQAGLVDDETFARYWVENREQFRPRGKRALRQELREKGIASDHVEAALAEYEETAAARQVAEEQARRLMHLPPDVFKRRLSQRMARRGFSYNLIQEILATYPFPHLNSEESEDY